MMFFCLDCLGGGERMPQHEKNFRKTLTYKTVARNASSLLTACWEQDWDHVLRLCESHPEQTYWKSQNSGRTALHLATMPGARCPTPVLSKLMETNPYAVVESDRHKFGGTPLHFVCGSFHRDDPGTVRMAVTTALTVQNQVSKLRRKDSRPRDFWSPLFLAAKWGAPPQTLQALVEGGRQQSWIAPWTGAESYQSVPASPSYSSLECVYKQFEKHRGISDAPLDVNVMKQIAQKILHSGDVLPPLEFSEDEIYLKHWANLIVLMRPCIEAPGFLLLHAAAKLYRPIPGLLRLICLLYPEHHLIKDRTGQVPLHAAITNKIHPFFKIADNDHPIQVLLEACPASSMALQTIQGHSLFSAFLAASCDARLDAIFNILQASPDAIELQRQQFLTTTHT